MVFGVAYSTLRVFSNSFLKKVCFALQGDGFHPRKWVVDVVDSGLFQFTEESVGTEANVLSHEGCIHACESSWECFANEFVLDLDSAVNNLPDACQAGWFEEAVVECTCKIKVQGFISANQFICKA